MNLKQRDQVRLLLSLEVKAETKRQQARVAQAELDKAVEACKDAESILTRQRKCIRQERISLV